MIRAILFDLDDTLYVERDFILGGFAAVAAHVAGRGFGPPARVQALLEEIHLGEGRDRVFDKAAARLGFPEHWVPDLVHVFRSHAPVIAPAADVTPTLARLRARYKLGCVTDGWLDVQKRKLAALGLAPLLDAVVIADEHGRAYWKPHPLPFLNCCRLLGIQPGEAVFVGDNPERDIRGARGVGMACIRLRRDRGYFGAPPPPSDAPDAEITGLAELETVLTALEATTV
jgi:putative hydrolase of the HAD superfamily